MKASKIIKKNIQLLLRSRISTLVIVLGPLMVIFLVGLSFSTNTYNLRLGVYSESYSDLSESIISNLTSEGYGIVKYLGEAECVESVKQGRSHSCIAFPPDMNIEDDAPDLITFYVDPSQINLVYLVQNTLVSSISEKSGEISRGLTGNLVTTINEVEILLDESKLKAASVLEQNTKVTSDVEAIRGSLDDIDYSTGTVEVNVEDIQADLDALRDDALEIVTEGLDFIDDLEDTGLDSNQSGIVSDLEDALMELNTSIEQDHNTTAKELAKFADKISEEYDDLSEKFEAAKDVNANAVKKLGDIKSSSDKLKADATELDTKIKSMIAKIGSIPVRDTESIVSPLLFDVQEVAESESNLGFLFPSLVVMLIMFIGLLLPSMLTIMEKNSQANFRIFLTPTKKWLFVFATFATSMILVLFQIMIILVVSKLYFNLNLNNVFNLTLSLLLITTLFILLGMLIGHIFNTEEMAMFACISIGTLLLLTSGIIFPLESMPASFIEKARFNPVVLGSEAFGNSLLFNAGFNDIKGQLGYLFLFSAALLGLIMLFTKVDLFQYILKAPNRQKAKREHVINQFDFGERKAKSLPEFLVSVQNMEMERFSKLMEQNAIADWIAMVHKNNALSLKVSKMREKSEIIRTLVEELKKGK